MVKLTVVPRRDQLDVSSSLINAPIRISLDSTNMHSHIFLSIISNGHGRRALKHDLKLKLRFHGVSKSRGPDVGRFRTSEAT